MASKELITTVQGYENYISVHGVDEEVINAYVQAVEVALRQEKDVEYGLMLSDRAKSLINDFVLLNTNGMDVWELEKFSFQY